MPEPTSFSVRPADWRADEIAIAGVRRAVFIEEQAVPEELEWEVQDPDCDWFVACANGGEIIGCVRLTPEGRIGRMAVTASWRYQRIGTALLAAALDLARGLGFRSVRLSAQTHAVPFYTRFGFHAEGDIYQDAGIPHFAMTLSFKESP